MDLPLMVNEANIETGLHASDITAICSVIVAACALCLSFWQARKAHLQSLISVKPVLELHFAYNKDSAINTFETIVLFSNVGLGPAQIVSWRYFINDEEISDDRKLTENYTTQVFKQAFDPSIHLLTATGRAKGNIIKVGYTETLLRLATTINNEEYIISQFANIRLIIEYKDMYGNLQPVLDTKEDSIQTA